MITMTTGIKTNDDKQLLAEDTRAARAEALPLVMTLVKNVADDRGGGGGDGSIVGGDDCVGTAC